MMNLERVIDVKVRFDDLKEWRFFDFAIINCYQEFVDRMFNFKGRPLHIIGGFDDGHVEVIFPVRKRRLKEFKQKIRWFNQYYPYFSEHKKGS